MRSEVDSPIVCGLIDPNDLPEVPSLLAGTPQNWRRTGSVFDNALRRAFGADDDETSAFGSSISPGAE